MTKDEAIEVLRSAIDAYVAVRSNARYRGLIAAFNATEHIEAPTSEAVAVPVWELFTDGWDGVDNLDGDWMQTLPIGTKLYYLPAEAVAEKPQDDRASASPAEPALRDGATASGKAGALTAEQMNALAKVIAGRVGKNASVAPELCFAPALFALQDAFSLASTQPAADPAPVPAQTGTRAKPDFSKFATLEEYREAVKRAEGATEREKFEAFMRAERPTQSRMIENGTASIDLKSEWLHLFTGWQARGQQAGVPEGFVQAVRVMVANDGGDGSRYDAGALIKARDSVKAMLAAAPGEAG